MTQEVKASIQSIRMGPRKLRLLVDLIRGQRAADALVQLQFSTKAAAKPVRKLLLSAIANAKQNYGMSEDSLIVKTAFVNSGDMLYRWMPRAFGRAAPFRRRAAHVTLVLTGEKGETKEVKETVEKVEDVKEKKPTKAKKVTKKKETKNS